MKTIVIYTSQTGFTKQYANWIAKEAKADISDLKKAKKMNLDSYEAIVFGGWTVAGSISKIKWFKSHIDKYSNKKLIVFCVGGSPIESPDVWSMLNRCFSEEERKKVNVFYCPGGINYESMKFFPKLLLKMFRSICNLKKNKTEGDIKMLEMLSSSYDISDKKYIEPILNCLEENAKYE